MYRLRLSPVPKATISDGVNCRWSNRNSTGRSRAQAPPEDAVERGVKDFFQW
jgi:hypothetical protein